jgi:hypothetical protein
MRRIVLVLFALTLLLGVVDRAAAQILSTTVTVDENGHGTIMFPGGGTIPLASALGQDTGPGGRSNALIYSLFSPPGLTGGDVLVTEPGGQVGDLLRFNPNQFAPDQTPGALVFYSLPGGTDLADLAGFPTGSFTNTLTIPEINGVITYTPQFGQPGFVNGSQGTTTFVATSPDPGANTIPEPTSLVLFGVATAGCLAWRRWRTRRAPSAGATQEG